MKTLNCNQDAPAQFAASGGYAANVQRALKTQHERKAANLCIECGLPSVDGWRCDRHKRESAERSRNYYRRKHGIPLNAPDQRKRHNVVVSHTGEKTEI